MRHPADNLAGIAARQHGRVTTAQLRALGFDKHRVKRWVAAGRLHREHVGVYAVGHPGLSVVAGYMSAVLAGGEGAVLSHRAAAHLLRLRSGAVPPAEVTVATLAGRARPGIVIHRVRALPPPDVTVHRGVPVTTVARTLLDLAPMLAPAPLTRACHEAWVHHHIGPPQIEACMARNPFKPGIPALRRALGSDVTLSVLEDMFVAMLRRRGLALPRTNIDRRGDKVDCHWPQLGLTVELLSYRFHGTRRAFELDVARRRRSSHVAFTYGDITERPARTLAELEELLSARASASR